jgi:hypothetical protein
MVLCSFSLAMKLRYKFCLLSENSNVEDYVTEYFIQELVSGTMFVLSLRIWRNSCCTSEIIIYTVFTMFSVHQLCRFKNEYVVFVQN